MQSNYDLSGGVDDATQDYAKHDVIINLELNVDNSVRVKQLS